MRHAVRTHGPPSVGFILLFLLPAWAHAQTSHVDIDRRTVRLSESVRVTLSVEGAAPLRVELATPLSAESQAAWRVKAANPPAVAPLPGGRERWAQTFTLDPWVPADPLPLSFATARVKAGNEPEREVSFDTPEVRVTTTVTEPRADAARPVTGIEQLPPPPPPHPESFAWAFLLGAVLVVAAMTVVGIVRRARRTPPPLPPREWALAELDRLDGSDGTELADSVAAVVRGYVARTFGVAAPKQTTAELLDAANRAGWPSGLDAILGRCDRAKFAGEAPTTVEGRELVAAARGWVERASPPADPH